ncbi:MAG: translation initiation factor Sui1 [Pseudomonadota bacterium]
MKSRSSSGGLVYSTETGRMCPVCRNPVDRCACKRPAAAVPAGDGIVRVSRETKGRGGKAVTVVKGVSAVDGVAVDAAGLVRLAQQLKAACGSGGTVKDGVIEVQGDHCDKVMALLTAQGHKVKRAGG